MPRRDLTSLFVVVGIAGAGGALIGVLTAAGFAVVATAWWLAASGASRHRQALAIAVVAGLAAAVGALGLSAWVARDAPNSMDRWMLSPGGRVLARMSYTRTPDGLVATLTVVDVDRRTARERRVPVAGLRDVADDGRVLLDGRVPLMTRTERAPPLAALVTPDRALALPRPDGTAYLALTPDGLAWRAGGLLLTGPPGGPPRTRLPLPAGQPDILVSPDGQHAAVLTGGLTNGPLRLRIAHLPDVRTIVDDARPVSARGRAVGARFVTGARFALLDDAVRIYALDTGRRTRLDSPVPDLVPLHLPHRDLLLALIARPSGPATLAELRHALRHLPLQVSDRLVADTPSGLRFAGHAGVYAWTQGQPTLLCPYPDHGHPRRPWTEPMRAALWLLLAAVLGGVVFRARGGRARDAVPESWSAPALVAALVVLVASGAGWLGVTAPTRSVALGRALLAGYAVAGLARAVLVDRRHLRVWAIGALLLAILLLLIKALAVRMTPVAG